MTYTVSDGFPYYIQVLGEHDYLEKYQSQETLHLLESIGEEHSCYRYAQDKWSIKQILGHITDHERIMMYRILRFSRNDTTTLPGYDQNTFVENSRFDELTFESLITDYKNVRNATNSFIASLSQHQLRLKGTAWKYELTVEEFLKSTIGHEIHHINIIKYRYMNSGS